MVIVPRDTPGVKVVRPLMVYGFDGALYVVCNQLSLESPHGHMEISFTNVRVPIGNILVGEGAGFLISQVHSFDSHHSDAPGSPWSRASSPLHASEFVCLHISLLIPLKVGAAERSLSLMSIRATTRKTFGKLLAQQGTVLQVPTHFCLRSQSLQDIAKSRVEIDEARLLVLRAAYMLDTHGAKVARHAITAAKIATPSMAVRVIDRAIQVALSGCSFPDAQALWWSWRESGHNAALLLCSSSNTAHC